MVSLKERSKKAVEAMKQMGFQSSRTLPVLKKLLKACENNWEHIEADNYSLLIEAVFEAEVPEERDTGRKRIAAEEEEHELQRTKQRRRHDENGPSPPKPSKSAIIGSPSMNSPVKDRKSVSNLMGSNGWNHLSGSSSRQQERKRKAESEYESQRKAHRVSPQELANSHTWIECLKETEIKPDLSIKKENAGQMDRNDPTMCKPLFVEFPVLMLQPELEAPAAQEPVFTCLEGHYRMLSLPQNGDEDSDESILICTKKNGADDAIINAGESTKNIEIASSKVGEKKASLFCNVSGVPDFHAPCNESVLKRVEDRFMRLHPEIGFSLMDMMKEVCKSILEFGADSAAEEQGTPIKVTPLLDSLKKSEISERLVKESDNQGILAIDDGYRRGEDYNRKGKAIDRSPSPEFFGELALIPVHEPMDSDLPLHDVNDISKGEEVVKIPIINEFPGEQFPPFFTYIPHNTVYKRASVNFSLARIGDEDCCSNCTGDCLLSSLPCACAQETGGEFAYALGGLLKNEFLDEFIAVRHHPRDQRMVYCKDCPLERAKDVASPGECKGHLARKFIKECWRKCRCYKQCGNRVVQQGIGCNLQVFWTPSGKGWGLRSTEDLPRGAFICEYVGEVLTNKEFYERTLKMPGNQRLNHPVLLDADWGSEGVLKDEKALCLDGTFYGNISRFINHRCFDANLVDVPVEIESPDRHFYHVAFFTTRKIDAFEELTWDYGINFDDRDPAIEPFQCQCESSECRDKSRPGVSGNRAAGIRII